MQALKGTAVNHRLIIKLFSLLFIYFSVQTQAVKVLDAVSTPRIEKFTKEVVDKGGTRKGRKVEAFLKVSYDSMSPRFHMFKSGGGKSGRPKGVWQQINALTVLDVLQESTEAQINPQDIISKQAEKWEQYEFPLKNKYDVCSMLNYSSPIKEIVKLTNQLDEISDMKRRHKVI